MVSGFSRTESASWTAAGSRCHRDSRWPSWTWSKRARCSEYSGSFTSGSLRPSEGTPGLHCHQEGSQMSRSSSELPPGDNAGSSSLRWSSAVASRRRESLYSPCFSHWICHSAVPISVPMSWPYKEWLQVRASSRETVSSTSPRRTCPGRRHARGGACSTQCSSLLSFSFEDSCF